MLEFVNFNKTVYENETIYANGNDKIITKMLQKPSPAIAGEFYLNYTDANTNVTYVSQGIYIPLSPFLILREHYPPPSLPKMKTKKNKRKKLFLALKS